MLTLGIDPDSKDLSLATWDNGPVDARVVHVVGSASNYEMLAELCEEDLLWTGRPAIVAIEGQQLDRRRARPEKLFKLAHMTGAAALRVRQIYRGATILVPTPKEWKGQIQKHAHQARLYNDLGWGYEIVGTGKGRYARPRKAPSAFSHITKGQWKHVGDAMLLARWAQDQEQRA